MKAIKIAVVDSEREFCSLIRQYTSMFDDVDFVGAAYDGLAGLGLIEKKQPDVVILGDFIHELDAIGLLKRLSKLSIKAVPSIIVVAEYPLNGIVSNAAALGINYIMSRKSDIDEIIDRCRMAVENVEKMSSADNADQVAEELITVYMQSIGIPANVKGFHYLRYAILIVYKNPLKGMSITKELYPEVAKRFDTDASKVERNIRNAIEIAFTRGNEETYEKIFGNMSKRKTGRPSNSEFIAQIADIVNREIKKNSKVIY